MPTIFREKGYRFFFYEADLVEPMHVHIVKSGKTAKFWIMPLSVAVRGGFRNHELNDIEDIIKEHYNEIVAAWNEEKDKRDNS
ncbi:MAG: DUF4160 domain-containing protein [Caldilineaceae bacterium]|jgi:hypothetical protein